LIDAIRAKLISVMNFIYEKATLFLVWLVFKRNRLHTSGNHKTND